MLRRVLHFFRHEWAQWTYSGQLYGYYYYQRRQCDYCKLLEERKL